MGRKTDWIKKHLETAYKGLTAVGIIVALVGLSFLIAQTRSLEEQTRILSEEYRAAYRPYLAIENITTQSENGSSFNIQINVKNYGQIPATNVSLQKVIIGGADVEYDRKTGIYTFIYTSNGTYVVSLVGQNYPPDFIFFPGKEQLIVVPDVDRPTYETTVLETKVMYVALLYSSGLDQYYYIARATLEKDTWKVMEHRGN